MPSPSFRARHFPFLHARLVLYVIFVLFAALPAHADSWALLIGIDQYKDHNRINDLGGAAADAHALAKVMQDVLHLPEDHIQVLASDRDEENRPDRTRILDALATLASSAKEGDTVFVFYSGHGIEIDGTSYLLPYDASALSDANLADSALSTEIFTSRLRQIKARALILAFDMCRSDPRKGSRAIGGDTDNKPSIAIARGLDFASGSSATSIEAATSDAWGQVVVTFYSCGPTERSFEDRLQTRGYFSEFLEKGLQGGAADASGTVRVDQLAKYLEKNVSNTVRENQNGASQTPYKEMKGPGVEGFVLVSGAVNPQLASSLTPMPDITVVDTYAHITVNIVNAADAQIIVDHKVVRAGQEISIDPGREKRRKIKIEVSAGGYRDIEKEIEIVAGQRVSFPVTLDAAGSPILTESVPAELPAELGGVTVGRIKRNSVDGAPLVYVPAGEFTMGDDQNIDNPRHKVVLSSYYIYKNLVTVAMYRKFCLATNRKMPPLTAAQKLDDHPIVMVTWQDASDYCAWANASLPTEAQWEKAARGTDGRDYPWKGNFDSKKLWCSTRPKELTKSHAVGGFLAGASPYGVLDMAGNVWQWCEDWYDDGFWSSRNAARRDPVNEKESEKSSSRVTRGGSYAQSDIDLFMSANRNSTNPTVLGNDVGFRAVVRISAKP